MRPEHVIDLQQAVAQHYEAARVLLDVLPSEATRQQHVGSTMAEIARERYEVLSSGHNYDVCPENDDGWHGPLVDAHDPEAPAGFATIECQACGLQTSITIPEVQSISWW